MLDIGGVLKPPHQVSLQSQNLWQEFNQPQLSFLEEEREALSKVFLDKPALNTAKELSVLHVQSQMIENHENKDAV